MSKFIKFYALIALSLVIVLFPIKESYSQPYSLNLVADTQTPIPGGFGTFDILSDPVSLDTVESEAFLGSANPSQGIYTNVGGGVILVADEGTPIPGGSGSFTNFNNPVSLGGGDVAFRGVGSGQRGIYTSIGGTLALVADLSTPIPGGSGNFTNFGNPVSLGGGDVAFRGVGSGQRGIYNAILQDQAPVINGFNGRTNRLIKNRHNKISISGVTPNKKAWLFWGFKRGTFTINGGKCGGTELKINPNQLIAKL